jgi:release factor glutamine methyltransferase
VEHLLAGVLELDRLSLYLQFDRPLTAEELGRFKPLLRRRAAREPLQYILGRASFREMEVRVDPRVLIPRPETEELVQAVLDWAHSRDRTDLRALDVGTGSGVIALALVTEGPFSSVIAVEESHAALGLAQENSKRYLSAAVDEPSGTETLCFRGSPRDEGGPPRMLELREGDLFLPVAGERFDVVVSNPPYVAEGERHVMEPEILDWEPDAALFAGSEGLDVLKRLIRDAPDHLVPGGLLALEIGAGQGDRVAGLVMEAKAFEDIRVMKDLAGKDRILLAVRS